MKCTWMIVLVLVIQPVIAQQKKPAVSKTAFAAQVSAGLLEGERGSFFQWLGTAGIRHGTWFTGIGSGVDYYWQRSVPVYLSVSKLLSTRSRSFFIQGEGGLNFPWLKDQPRFINMEDENDFSHGLYYNGMFGFATPVGKSSNSVLLSVGYSYKQLKETRETVFPCLVPPCPVHTDEYNYYLRRLSVRLGWQF